MARKYKHHTYYGVLYSYYLSDKKTLHYDVDGGLTLREARLIAKYMMQSPIIFSTTVIRMIHKIDRRSGEDNFEKV